MTLNYKSTFKYASVGSMLALVLILSASKAQAAFPVITGSGFSPTGNLVTLKASGPTIDVPVGSFSVNGGMGVVSGVYLQGDTTNNVTAQEYTSNANWTSTSPVNDISKQTNMAVAFGMRCVTEATDPKGASSDYMALELSPDGHTWTEAGRWNQTNAGPTDHNEAVSIPAFDHSANFQFRFRWVTNATDNAYYGCLAHDIKLVPQNLTFTFGNITSSGTSLSFKLQKSVPYGNYKLTAQAFNSPDSNAIDVYVDQPAPTTVPTVTFSVTPTTVMEGHSASINWSTIGATSCIGSNTSTILAGPQPLSGSYTYNAVPLNARFPVPPSLAYGLSCSNALGMTTQNGILPIESVKLDINPASIAVGASTKIYWKINGDLTCTTSGGPAWWTNALQNAGSNWKESTITETPDKTYTLGLTCADPAGVSTTTQQTVTVGAAAVSLSAPALAIGDPSAGKVDVTSDGYSNQTIASGNKVSLWVSGNNQAGMTNILIERSTMSGLAWSSWSQVAMCTNDPANLSLICYDYPPAPGTHRYRARGSGVGIISPYSTDAGHDLIKFTLTGSVATQPATSTPPVATTTSPVVASTRVQDVTNLYLTLQHRQPDAQGLAYWVGTTYTIDQMKQQMMAGIEYQTKQKIIALYQSILNRLPSDAELSTEYLRVEANGWSMSIVTTDITPAAPIQTPIQPVQTPPPTQPSQAVVYQPAPSPSIPAFSADADTAGSDSRHSAIEQLYVILQGREPDSGGWAYWTNYQGTMSQIEQGMMSGIEFTTKQKIRSLFLTYTNNLPTNDQLSAWYTKASQNNFDTSVVDQGLKAGKTMPVSYNLFGNFSLANVLAGWLTGFIF